MNQITFREKKNYLSLGRNGYVWTDGIALIDAGRKVEIMPINSKGNVSSCSISIPKEHINEFINELEKFKNEEI